MLIHELPNTERPRERLATLGPQALDTAELLAIFLGTGTKGRNAIQIGRDLLKQFGSLHALGAVGVDALQTCHGVGLAKACKLAAAFEIGARLARETMEQKIMNTPELIYEHFAPQLSHLNQEKLIVMLVDSRLRHIGTHTISSGTLTETSAHPREIFRPAILHQAYGFVLLHNHPSGDPGPSNADTQFTKQLTAAASFMGIRFLDHLIIGRPGNGRCPYYSYREHGELDD